MKVNKIIYWIATAVMTFVFGFSIYIHLFKTPMVQGFYESLGFPVWLVLPSGLLKTLAIAAIVSNFSKVIKEWAYAGLFIDAILAFSAHQMAQDGAYSFALVAIIAIALSRIFWTRSSLDTKTLLSI